MFLQIHMLQSLPPGNVNRDEQGHPKRAIFGGVSRGRISSQSLKRSWRLSPDFKAAFGSDHLAIRTVQFPGLVAKQLRTLDPTIREDEVSELTNAIRKKFKSEKKTAAEDNDDGTDDAVPAAANQQIESSDEAETGQLVFFPEAFAQVVAGKLLELRGRDRKTYEHFKGPSLKGLTKQERSARDRGVNVFIDDLRGLSKVITVDIALFGRMTTSDLIADVEASCQVAHAISTNEVVNENEYFTAMDDRPAHRGAGYIGSGDDFKFFNSALYYKYLNVDMDGLKRALPGFDADALANVAGVLVTAAALANPSGSQNSFAAHGVPEVILVESSRVKRPISYANAFLEPVEGGVGRNLMRESARALFAYVDEVGRAFSPLDTQRFLLAFANADGAALAKAKHTPAGSLDELRHVVTAHVAAAYEKA